MKESNNYNIQNVWKFFILTFIYSWILWLPYVMVGLNIIKLPETLMSIRNAIMVIGAFGPLFAASTLIGRKSGWIGIKALINKGFNFRVKPIYIILALLIPLITTAGTHYLVNITGIDTLPKTFIPEGLPIPLIVVFVLNLLGMILVGGGQEEFGWRGYAQEPLQEHFGMIKGSILLGIVWGLWHLPLWYMPGDGHEYYSFISFMGLTISLSVTMAILYNTSGKKLIIPWIFHGMNNAVVPFFPVLHMEKVPQPGYWIWVGFNALVAFSMAMWFYRKSKESHHSEAIKG